jgi:hypothetical protein
MTMTMRISSLLPLPSLPPPPNRTDFLDQRAIQSRRGAVGATFDTLCGY